MDPAIIAAVAVGSLALIVIASGLRVVREFERGVVLRFGRRGPLLEPGLRLIMPLGIDRLTRVDLRTSLIEIPAHEVITRDGVPVRVSAAVQYQVLNPLLAVTRVVDFRGSTTTLALSALRDVISRSGLRDLLVDQEGIRSALVQFVDARAEPWGVRITAVDLRDVDLPEAMRRAMARQTEMLGDDPARRAHEMEDVDTANRLADAAQILATQPRDVQMQFLRALTEVGKGNSTIVVVPLPQDLVQPFVDLQGHAAPPRPKDELPAADRTDPPRGAPDDLPRAR